MVASAFVLGIAGGTASGKSTLATLLADSLAPLSNHVFRTDAYFKPRETIPRLHCPTLGREMPHMNRPDSADLPRLLQDLDALLISQPPPDVVIIEGLMVLHDEAVRARLDLRLFVHTDDDVRAIRRLRRNLQGGRGDFDEIAGYYMDCAKAGHEAWVAPSRTHADLVVSGGGNTERAALAIADHVRAELARRTAEL